jgi:uncharacterized protein (TIGR02653 family)
MDRIDTIVTEQLEGLVVRKDLADKFRGRFSVPTYVGEFLIGKYCATSDEAEIQEGLVEVERLLSRRVVRTGEHELFKAMAREQGSIQIIDIIKARLDTGRDEYIASLPSLSLDDARIPSQLVIDNDRMLTGGFYAQVGLTYVPGDPRPFIVTEVRPIQAHARAGLDRLSEARALMTTGEWKDFLLRSVGLEPYALTAAAQDAYFLRMVPFVVRNYNMVELGPRGTGKSHLFQQVSPYAYLLSGGQTTVAQLFVNNASGQRGLVTQHDVVAFDEIAGIRFKDRDGINVMKGYMASGEFARGRESIRAEGGMAFLGNFDVDVADQLRRGHLLGPMPEAMRDDTAFMDRLHAYVPGWDIPAVGSGQKTDHYGLVSDLLAQWWHELRAENRYVGLRERVHFNDNWRGRDVEAVTKTIDGLIKLLYPDPAAPVSQEDLEWAVRVATISRRRVKEAQAFIGADEFGAVELGYSVDGRPTDIPHCPERDLLPAAADSEFPGLGPVVPTRSGGLPGSLPDPIPVGFKLGEFGEVVAHRGDAQGAFGRVYQVKRALDGRSLAGKVFKRGSDAAYGDQADDSVRQEVKALEQLSHQNIVRVLGPMPITSAGEWIVLSEWIEGTTLEDAASGRAPMPGGEVYSVGEQLLSALRYLEAKGVVHRDLKPANVMLAAGSEVKIIDFNLMREAGHQSALAGTPGYMPPDFMAFGPVIEHGTDRYSVGVILYELLVNSAPYQVTRQADGMPAFSGPIPATDARSDVPSEVSDFLMKGVAPQAADRFATADEMARAWRSLEPLLQGLP